MKIKANVEVNSEEILLGFKPEYLLEYIKSNYPTFYRDNVERPATIPAEKVEKKYYMDQWFVREGTYYVLTYMDGKAFLISLDFKDGKSNRWSDIGMEVKHEHGMPPHIMVSQIEQLNDKEDDWEDEHHDFQPIDYKDIPKYAK